MDGDSGKKRLSEAEDKEWLAPLVQDACAKAVKEELTTGLGAIRQIIREEIDRDSEEEESEDDDEEETQISGRQEWKLIICVRSDLNMTVGKVAAQVGHAVHHSVTHSRWRDLQAWESCGSKKVTLRVESEEELRNLEKTAISKGLLAESIQDAGHTEVAPGTTTVLALGPALAKHIDAITGHLKPLPDRATQLEREVKKFRERAERLQLELDAEKKKKKNLVKLMGASRSYV
eukprot:TRINITY_DN16475_c1_g1_i1.p1 TRINITY_DN16475_c1_g1~~TRINITY_DN16475_c1_g1_i1.p1  ORF type:complete len:233 (+),score=57.49 TRINITY_DN16475_c1_g1_i1:72-770(+)